MRQFVVTYKVEGSTCVKVLDGNDIAFMYGYSDCNGVEVISVWAVNTDGNLEKVVISGSVTAPFNRLFVTNPRTGSEDVYWWDEH